MKSFSVVRFVVLLARTLEVGVVAALALRWLDPLLAVWAGIPLPGSAVEAAWNFSFFAVVLLLVTNLWLLLTRQPRAVPAALRTLVYIIVFLLSPYQLGGSERQSAQRPNQAMERTATSLAFTSCVVRTSSLRASLAPGGRRSSWSR